MVKKRFWTKCPHCNSKISGTSEAHAEANLRYHQQKSRLCKKVRAILNKKTSEAEATKQSPQEETRRVENG